MNKLSSNIWKIYLYEILSSMFFALPILVLFWQDNGLNITQIMVLQSIYAISVVILEVPSWYFADIHWRKKSLIIASFMWALAMVSYSLWSSFYHFLIWEMFFAISVSFTSWTLSALVYDTLQNLWKQDEYKKIWWNVLFYGLVTLALSNILGWFIAKIDLRYALYASIPFFIVMIPLSFSLQEPKKSSNIIKKWYTKELFKIIKNTIIKNNRLKWIVVYSAIIYAFNYSAVWLYQPYFNISGLDIIYFWVVFASFQIVAAFSSKYAHKIEEKLWQKYSLIMLALLVSLSYFLMSKFVFIFSFLFAFIQQFVRWFKQVVINDYINKITDSSIRATILSAESFVWRLIFAIIVPIIWYIVDIYSLQQALFVISITSFISGAVILLLLKKDKVL